MCQKIVAIAGPHFYHYSRQEMAALILADHGFANAWDNRATQPKIKHYCLEAPRQPEKPDWLSALALPELPSTAAVAQWLRLPLGELAWFADQWRNDAAASPSLQHYRYRWLEKRSGGFRLIEMPKVRLRIIQNQILHKLLNLVPAHSAAHGFRKAHSCVTHAALHTDKRVVIRIDLKDFFPSINGARIHALFAKLGYPYPVAGVLSRLCSHVTSSHVINELAGQPEMSSRNRSLFRSRHLPQGAPCSPALANLCAYRLDLRLDALATSLNATYSRYADDLTFSGNRNLERSAQRLHVQVGAIANEEGFSINFKKNKIMRAGTRQLVTGIVVNSQTNIKRIDFDTLKAILTNCVRHGPTSQNQEQRGDFRGYLTGKVAYLQMVNAARGLRLRVLLEQIIWP